MTDRPWCCPEPRCTPIYSVQGGEEPLSKPQPGEMFICFGEAPATVEFIYDGVRHVNDLRQCSYTALKGLIAFQENADDWRGLQNAYGRALRILDARRSAAVGGSPDPNNKNEEEGLIMEEVQPITGDVVLYEMPKEWRPELGIRIYPAIVLYPNPNYGHDGLDLQVFAAPYDYPGGLHVSARRGESPGTWQSKRSTVNQQPLR